MLGRLSLCKGIYVRSCRCGSESWITSSLKSCPSAFLESGELVLRWWQSWRIIIPCRTPTWTCLIQWFHGSWRVNVPCCMCVFWTLPAFWKKKKFVGLHFDPTIVNLVGAWTREAEFGGEFVFLAHGMFFEPRHGTVILFRSAWLQHCTMPVQDRRR